MSAHNSATNRRLIEAYDSGRRSQFFITKRTGHCYKCDVPCVTPFFYWHQYFGRGSQPGFREKGKWFFWTPLCHRCLAKFDELYQQHKNLKSFEDQHWSFLGRPEIDFIAGQDRSASIRWVRHFLATGKFSKSQFAQMCAQYGNICLRCGKSRPLVADHVVPLAKGGSNDISNIQPLCADCNGIKSDKSTDNGKRRRIIKPALLPHKSEAARCR